jgi:hypothetical protein
MPLQGKAMNVATTGWPDGKSKRRVTDPHCSSPARVTALERGEKVHEHGDGTSNMPVRINYLDASAIVKLVIEEERSKIVRDYFSYFGDSYLTTSLCFSESLGVLNLKYKKGDVAQEVYLRATEELLALGRNCSIEIHDVKISERRVFDEVEQMISAHQKRTGKKIGFIRRFPNSDLKKGFPQSGEISEVTDYGG